MQTLITSIPLVSIFSTYPKINPDISFIILILVCLQTALTSLASVTVTTILLPCFYILMLTCFRNRSFLSRALSCILFCGCFIWKYNEFAPYHLFVALYFEIKTYELAAISALIATFCYFFDIESYHCAQIAVIFSLLCLVEFYGASLSPSASLSLQIILPAFIVAGTISKNLPNAALLLLPYLVGLIYTQLADEEERNRQQPSTRSNVAISSYYDLKFLTAVFMKIPFDIFYLSLFRYKISLHPLHVMSRAIHLAYDIPFIAILSILPLFITVPALFALTVTDYIFTDQFFGRVLLQHLWKDIRASSGVSMGLGFLKVLTLEAYIIIGGFALWTLLICYIFVIFKKARGPAIRNLTICILIAGTFCGPILLTHRQLDIPINMEDPYALPVVTANVLNILNHYRTPVTSELNQDGELFITTIDRSNVPLPSLHKKAPKHIFHIVFETLYYEEFENFKEKMNPLCDNCAILNLLVNSATSSNSLHTMFTRFPGYPNYRYRRMPAEYKDPMLPERDHFIWSSAVKTVDGSDDIMDEIVFPNLNEREIFKSRTDLESFDMAYADTLSFYGQPTYTLIWTADTHSPFHADTHNYTAQYLVNYTMPNPPSNLYFKRYHKAYEGLYRFIKTISESPIANDTVIVINGDHGRVSDGNHILKKLVKGAVFTFGEKNRWVVDKLIERDVFTAADLVCTIRHLAGSSYCPRGKSLYTETSTYEISDYCSSMLFINGSHVIERTDNGVFYVHIPEKTSDIGSSSYTSQKYSPSSREKIFMERLRNGYLDIARSITEGSVKIC